MTACDGPEHGYAVARRSRRSRSDDGTIAPTAAGGAMAFTPEYSLPTLRAFYSRFRPRIWTAYGFRDAFNLGAGWYATDELGIDQGPIVIMIENYRTQRVWRLFMQNAEVQRGLQRAGFVSLPFVALNLQPCPLRAPSTWLGTPRPAATTRSNTRPICSPGPPRPGSSKPPTAEPSTGSTPGRLSPCPLLRPRLSDSIACSS